MPQFSELVIACDTASKTGLNNAYSAFVILGVDRTNRKIYLLNVVRAKLSFPELVKKVDELFDTTTAQYPRCGYPSVVIEYASSGTQLIQHLKTVTKYTGHVKAVPADTDKITRFTRITFYLAEGIVLFPSVAGPWWADFRAELLTFPSSTFKDQCDAFAHGVKYAWSRAKYGPVRVDII